MNVRRMQNRATGAALVIGLILLAIMTLVASAGMTTSTLELRMAAGKRAAVSTFQAAENAIETALTCRRPLPGQTVTAADCPAVQVTPEVNYDFSLRRELSETTGLLPEGVSLGVDFVAVEYTITATAEAGRGDQVELAQGFYEVGFRE
jgi:Tfp pilus assembly protein PilX